jgi:hypothetical protein
MVMNNNKSESTKLPKVHWKSVQFALIVLGYFNAARGIVSMMSILKFKI